MHSEMQGREEVPVESILQKAAGWMRGAGKSMREYILEQVMET
jgi:hypothetical protein